MPGTCPGEDGVPYSLWRLDPVAVAYVFAALLRHLSVAPVQVCRKAPHCVQMLVFIPKIAGAMTAEEHRPLALPWTWIRILAKIAFVQASSHRTRSIYKDAVLTSSVLVTHDGPVPLEPQMYAAYTRIRDHNTGTTRLTSHLHHASQGQAPINKVLHGCVRDPNQKLIRKDLDPRVRDVSKRVHERVYRPEMRGPVGHVRMDSRLGLAWQGTRGQQETIAPRENEVSEVDCNRAQRRYQTAHKRL